MSRILLIGIMGIAVIQASLGQKFSRSLELPLAFHKPIINDAFYLSPIKPVLQSNPWIVICDRSEPELTQTYKQADANSEKFKNLEWLETYFVVDEQKEWVRVAKGNLKQGIEFYNGSVVDFGWVKKSNLLLWTSSLRNSATGIHLKAFLLNKASDVRNILKLKNKEIANIYKGPETATTISEKQIYEFYFVLKIENDRYLLCKNESTGLGMTDEIIGWVEKRRVNEWDTRMALEPNFDPKAFQERKDHLNYLCMGFADLQSVNNYAENGVIENVIWENDPIRLSPDQLAKENPRRFKGAVIRFPLLTNNDKSYTSGVIGDIITKNVKTAKEGKIDDVAYANIVEANQSAESRRNNYNVLFLIEGTNSLANYKSSIIESMKQLKIDLNDLPGIKFGIAIYRDVLEKQSNKLFEIKKMTSDLDEVIGFVQKAEFGRWHDNDDFTALNYGMHQALLEAGLDKSQTNIVCVLGSYADFSTDIVRRSEAEATNSPYLVSREKIEVLLASLGAHLMFVQVKTDESIENEKYSRQSRRFISEAAKLQYDDYKNIKKTLPSFVFGNPDIGDLEDGNDLELSNGAIVGRMIRPEVGKTMSSEKVQWAIAETFKEIIKYNEGTKKSMTRLIEDGSSIGDISAGAFAPAMAKLIYMYLKDKKTAAYSEEDVKKLLDDKYKLYQTVYFAKKSRGAFYDQLSFVLFMPKTDLEDYVKQLKVIKRSLSETDDARREALYNFLVSMLERYTGNKSITRDANRLSTQDLREIMQGLKKEWGKSGVLNLQLTSQEDFNIGDVKDRRKVSNEQVHKFVTKIVQKADAIENILELGDDYEYSYKSSKNRYYWIPLELTF